MNDVTLEEFDEEADHVYLCRAIFLELPYLF
jgi:hypothetical protein